MLRADLQQLLKKLILLHESKLVLLKNLSRNLMEKRYRVKSADTEGAAEFMDEDRIIMDQIDVLDYDLAGTGDEIINLTGILREDYYFFLKSLDSPETERLFDLLDRTTEILELIMEENNGIITGFAQEKEHIEKDIRELARIRRIRPKIKKQAIDP